jgi:hypothetical protein
MCHASTQGALAPPQLWQEVSVFERLLYKNRSQHRRGRYFQRCLEVHVMAACAMPRVQGVAHRTIIARQLLGLSLQVKRHLQLLQMLQLPAVLALLEDGRKASAGGQSKVVTGMWCSPSAALCHSITALC